MARKKKQNIIIQGAPPKGYSVVDLDDALGDSFSSSPKEKLTIKQRIKRIEELDSDITDGLPWEIVRLFPDMSLYGSSISFCMGGDFVTREEAIEGIKLLLKELEGE